MPEGDDQPDGTQRFECAITERKAGEVIESAPDQGWSWKELDGLPLHPSGAPRAHVDALKLLAVLLQHNDAKEANQRMDCPADAWNREPGGEKVCTDPRLLIHDVGATFGGAGNRVREDSKADLDHWQEQMIWRDGKTCTTNLVGSRSSDTILDPVISESGRAFLAGLLMELNPAQIHDLFRVAQVTTRDRGTTLSEWESAFWYKAYQIVNHRCPE
jgi:hypothetical protein